MKAISTFFLLLLCHSCKLPSEKMSGEEITNEGLFDKRNQKSEKQYTLEVSKIVDIPVDTNSLNHSIYPVYYDDISTGRQYFVNGNSFLNSIDFYDIDSKKLSRRMMFPKEGPQGINPTTAFFIKSLDSIYIQAKPLTCYVVDSSGKIRSKANFPKSYAYSLNIGHNSLFFVRNDTAYYPFCGYVSSDKLAGGASGRYLSLKDNKVGYAGVNYPTFFRGNYAAAHHYMPHITYNGQDIVTQFGISSGVYTYNISTGQTQTYNLRSRYQKKVIPFTTGVSKTRDLDPAYEGTVKDNYYAIFYDKYRKIYYSFFRQGVAQKNPNTGKEQDFEDQPMSVIIADEHFRYMGETLLEPYKYFNNFVVSREGLMITNGHIKDKNVPEDKISFTLFKLEEVRE
jgi:hypothetical protein